VSRPFKVVGLYSRTRTEPDAFAFVGLADAQRALQATFPVAIRDRIDASTLAQSATVYAAKGTSIAELDALADRINRAFPALHAARPSDTVNQFRTGGEIFSLIAVGAALLALVIGGLSVVNTMLMAITERTREIGLKRAVGARTRHVVREVVAESSVIGLLGGLAGFLLGLAATAVLNATLASAAGGEIFYVTPTLSGLAIGLAVALGAVAGLIPSWRASRLDPVMALRSQ
jgi:putative ABC transport system permease protein